MYNIIGAATRKSTHADFRGTKIKNVLIIIFFFFLAPNTQLQYFSRSYSGSKNSAKISSFALSLLGYRRARSNRKPLSDASELTNAGRFCPYCPRQRSIERLFSQTFALDVCPLERSLPRMFTFSNVHSTPSGCAMRRARTDKNAPILLFFPHNDAPLDFNYVSLCPSVCSNTEWST